MSDKFPACNMRCHGPILGSIKNPYDVATLKPEELPLLAQELRDCIISAVSRTGGHLAPSLGVIELTIAMLRLFNPKKDKIIWDVGHQAYAYKLLTGRRDNFHTLRQHGGISGFPRMSESIYDHFGVGHASTSISAALGMAVARDLSGDDSHVIAVIGDGALTGGEAYEAMNQAGAMGKRLIVVLNDNEMSISRNVGALSFFFSRNTSSRWVRRIKREMEDFLQSIPGIGSDMLEIAKRSKNSFKTFFTPGLLFEALRFKYIGPVDGHNFNDLSKGLSLAASIDEPVLLHVLTQKGKGYTPAESDPTCFHGVGCFDAHSGRLVSAHSLSVSTLPSPKSFTDVFSETICELAEKDSKIIAISAAMPEGTGLSHFASRFPGRFIDVGICEGHAVTFAAGLATQGFKPVVAVYSTFLQRAYDQVIHDVCLQNLPVIFCLDRSGLVGEDGATHHGVFDISYLRHIPNLRIISPRDAAMLKKAITEAVNSKTPIALRYPRGVCPVMAEGQNLSTITGVEFQPGKGQFLCKVQNGAEKKLSVVAVGNCAYPAFEAAKILQAEHGIDVTVFDPVWLKPFDEEQILNFAREYENILVVEENILAGGFGSAILEFLNDNKMLASCNLFRHGLPDLFIEHGATKILRNIEKLDTHGLYEKMCAIVE